MQIPRTQTYTRFVRQEQQVSEHYVKLRTGTPDHSVGPNGYPYRYWVTEERVNGYQVSEKNGDDGYILLQSTENKGIA